MTYLDSELLLPLIPAHPRSISFDELLLTVDRKLPSAHAKDVRTAVAELSATGEVVDVNGNLSRAKTSEARR